MIEYLFGFIFMQTMQYIAEQGVKAKKVHRGNFSGKSFQRISASQKKQGKTNPRRKLDANLQRGFSGGC